MQNRCNVMIIMIVATIIIISGCGTSEKISNKIDTEQNIENIDNSVVSNDSLQAETEEQIKVENEFATEIEDEIVTENEITEPVDEQQLAVHTHKYSVSDIIEATCEATGVKSFVCVCGDSYTETIKARGHSYGAYVYNNDATYTSNGSQSAFCNNCGKEHRVVAEGTQKQGRYYTKNHLDIREDASELSEVIDKISINTYVEVISEEGEWVKIEYPDIHQHNEAVGYVKMSQLSEERIVTQEPEYGTVFYNNNEIDTYWEWVIIHTWLHWNEDWRTIYKEDGTVTYEGAWNGYEIRQNTWGAKVKHDYYEMYLIVEDVFSEFASSLEPPTDANTSIELDTVWVYMGDGRSE